MKKENAVLDDGMEPIFTGSEDEVLEWLSVEKNYTNALWVRIGMTKRVVAASVHLFDAKKRGWSSKKGVDHSDKEEQIHDILSTFADEHSVALNKAEFTSIYNNTVKQIIALFKGE